MKKKILGAVIAASMIISSFTGAYAQDSANVEISFKVGENTLMINGNPQTVETPYVVGEGVTLVPLRVITEAFGAEVSWNGDTKEITLTYPDVNILLQIGNTTAEVNSSAQPLLSAPELTPNGVTMVPLRFISETFGAEVSYDDATGSIKVIKSAQSENQENITVGVIDNKYIGDSAYGWSMENFKEATQTDINFDQSSVAFIVDDKTAILITINPKDEELDFEKNFTEMKKSFGQFTLIKADKETLTTGEKRGIIQAKDSTKYIDFRVFETDKYEFIVSAGTDVSDAEMVKRISQVLDTFTTSFINDDIHDISTVKNNMRTYESEMFKYSMNVPADFYKASSSTENTVMLFADDAEDYSGVMVNIYSKTGEETASSVAKKLLEEDKNEHNSELYTFEEITEEKFGENTMYAYRYSNTGTFVGEYNSIFAVMEKGNYIYEIDISVSSSRSDADRCINDILSSFKAEELDYNETGSILNSNAKEEGTYESKGGDFTFTVPADYTERASGSSGISLYNSNKSTSFLALTTENTESSWLTVTDVKETIKDKNTVKTIVDKNEKHGDKTFGVMIERIENEDSELATYRKSYIYLTKKKIYIISVDIIEDYYTSSNIEEIDAIVASAVFE